MDWFRLRKELRLRKKKKQEIPEIPKRLVRKISKSRSYVDALKSHGFKVLGSGSYSTVLAKDGSDRAIKVCRGCDAWPDYVIWGHQAGYAGRYTPKIYSYKYHGDFYVATMERLKGTLSGLEKEHHLRLLPSLADAVDGRPANDNLSKSLFDVVLPGFGEFFANFRQKFGRGHLDLHRGNWMFREDGSLVLTDPVTSSTTYKERFKLAAA